MSDYLLGKSPDIKLSDKQLAPFNRGFLISAPKQLFLCSWQTNIEKEFHGFLTTGKLNWEEDAPPFAAIPEGGNFFSEGYSETFNAKTMHPTTAAEQLNIMSLAKIPENLLNEEFNTRQQLAEHMSIVQTAEGMALATENEVARKAHLAMAKLCLRPLQRVTQTFIKARMAVRRLILY